MNEANQEIMEDESSGFPRDDLCPRFFSLPDPLPAPTETRGSNHHHAWPKNYTRNWIRSQKLSRYLPAGATGGEQRADGEGEDTEGEEHEENHGESEERRQGQHARLRLPAREESQVAEWRPRSRHQRLQRLHDCFCDGLGLVLREWRGRSREEEGIVSSVVLKVF